MGMPKVFTALSIGGAWIHGASVGVALGDVMLNRYWAFTLIFIAPVSILWGYSKDIKLRRFAAAIAYFIMSMVATSWALSVAWHRHPRQVGQLPDLGHDFFGERMERITFKLDNRTIIDFDSDILPDVFLGSTLVSTIVWGVFFFPQRVILIRRFLTCFATLMLFRCLTILVTSLPDSHPDCSNLTPKGDLDSGGASLEHLSQREKVREMVIKSMQVMVPVGDVTCGDMVFSGHTLLLVLSALAWHTYYPVSVQQLNYVKIFVWGWVFCGLLSIVFTHLHYTLDVVLAFYLAVTTWSTYHRIANDIVAGVRWSSKMVWVIDTMVIYPSIEYFEDGVDEMYIARWPHQIAAEKARRERRCTDCGCPLHVHRRARTYTDDNLEDLMMD